MLLTGRDGNDLEAARQRAGRHGADVITHRADLADDDDVQALADTALEHLGEVDILIHSLGLFLGGPVADFPVEDLDRLYRVNLRSPFLLTQTLLPSLLRTKGQIVFVNSSTGLIAHPTVSAYATTKFGLRALADSLRAELNPQGVRVLTVYPGRTASDMQAEVLDFEGKPYDPSRYAQPADIAGPTVLALALPRSAELTEVTIRPMQA